MALNPSTNATMAGRVTAADANYPYASSKDETAPGAGDGTPYFKSRADDIFGLQQALLKSASITPSGNADTALVSEYLQAMVELASGRAFNYDDSGVADAYVLDVQANQQAPRSYFDGLEAIYIPGNTNTGPSTADIAGLGPKSIVSTAGGGEIVAGIRTKLRYRLATDDLEIVTLNQIAQIQRTDDGTVSTTTAVMNDDDTIPQITEGAQVLSVSITPQNAASTLRIKAQVPGAANADAVIIAALHKTGVNDALKAVGINPGTDRREILTLNSEIAAGSTAAQTFTVRVGTNTGATLTVNGIGGAQKYGGVNNAFIEVEELLP